MIRIVSVRIAFRHASFVQLHWSVPLVLPTTISIIIPSVLVFALLELMALLSIVRLVIPLAKLVVSHRPTAPAVCLVGISILTNVIRHVRLSPILIKEIAPLV